jgi:sulfide:quinone oxidoreductase
MEQIIALPINRSILNLIETNFMKRLLILGAGTAGTMMANHLKPVLNKDEWEITIADESKVHYYQPGYIFIPFDMYTPEEVCRPTEEFIPEGVNFVNKKIDRIVADDNKVLMEDGTEFPYDILIIATGTHPSPEETHGMLGSQWRKTIFDFYTFDGSVALRDKLRDWPGGKFVVHIVEMPIKCPVAPLEVAFLADSYFAEKGIRDKVEISFVTPMSGAFTRPKAARAFEHILVEKNIKIIPDFAIERVENEEKKIIDYGGTEVSFDLLVTVPTNKGSGVIERSGFGDDLNYVPTHKGTLQSKVKTNIFVIGDASDLPTSKAGSVAHFEAEILTENIQRYIKGEPLMDDFDGHANCFVETGEGKALLLDFNYNQEPVEGTFPIPGVGPLRLLKESRMNHLGKLAFRWIYWNMLLKGSDIPFVSSQMTEEGKNIEKNK